MKARQMDHRPTLPLPAGIILMTVTISVMVWMSVGQPEAGEFRKPENPAATFASEIELIQKDMEWLRLRIQSLEKQGRFVPRRMHDSMAFKKARIASLEKLRASYGGGRSASGTAAASPREKTSKQPSPPHPLADTIEKKLADSGLDHWLERVSHDTAVVYETRLPILFSSGRADISSGYQDFLRQLASLVTGHDVRIVVDGFADTDPIQTRQFPSNFELGAARASAVVRALVKYGVPPVACRVGSTGEYRINSKKTSEWKPLQRHANIAVFFRS